MVDLPSVVGQIRDKLRQAFADDAVVYGFPSGVSGAGRRRCVAVQLQKTVFPAGGDTVRTGQMQVLLRLYGRSGEDGEALHAFAGQVLDTLLFDTQMQGAQFQLGPIRYDAQRGCVVLDMVCEQERSFSPGQDASSKEEET